MSTYVKPRHEDDAVNAQLPLLFEHVLRLSPERRRSCMLLASFFRFDEQLRLGEADANEADTDGQASGNPEDSLPALNTATDAEVCACSTNIAKRVALLENAGHKTTSVCRTVLKRHCNSVAISVDIVLALLVWMCRWKNIHSTHEKSKQTSDSQELLERMTVDRRYLQ